MTLKLHIVAAGLAGLALSGCVGDMESDGPLRTGTGAAEAACLDAVNANFSSNPALVTSSDFSEAATIVMLRAEGETWRCLASEDGVVSDLSVVE